MFFKDSNILLYFGIIRAFVSSLYSIALNIWDSGVVTEHGGESNDETHQPHHQHQEEHNSYDLSIDEVDPEIHGQKYVCITYLPHPEQNTLYFKIRGSFPTFEEARQRAMELSAWNPLFPIFVGEVGKFLPAQSALIDFSQSANHESDLSPQPSVPVNIIGEPERQRAEDEPTSNDSPKSLVCLACQGAERDSIFMPCRHVSFCTSCSNTHIQRSNLCPICRTKIIEVLNIFIN